MKNSVTPSSISTRNKILTFLLFRRSNPEDGCTIKDLADELGMSTNATRQYMILLEKEKLVTRVERKGETGRPAMLYTLHENAFDYFPKLYKEFGLELLTAVKSKYGQTETRKLMESIGIKYANELRDLIQANSRENYDEMPLKQKVENIAKALEEYGKFPLIIEDETSVKLQTFNCLVYGVVREEPLVCAIDETMLKELTGYKVTKEKCIRDGGDSCLYSISKTS